MAATAGTVRSVGASTTTSSRAGFEQRVSEFTLPNGLKFIVLERPNAPIVSCHTYVNVGAFDEQDGQSGIAHVLEHMAFKGSQRIGTKNFGQEAPLLDALDEVFYSLQDAQVAGSTREAARLAEKFKTLQVSAEELCVPNAFGSLLQQQGAVGLNATTSHDQTRYFLSLPSNKLELWMALEAERFSAPVFRQLYSEKKVIQEERRLRVDDAPLGPFAKQFAVSSLSNNYRRPVIGWAEDVAALGRREVQSFFDRYYGPTNLTMSVVGDTTAEEVYRLANKYFGGWTGPAGYQTLPRGVSPSEPMPQPAAFVSGEVRELRGQAKAGPAVMLGFYRPGLVAPGGVALQVVTDILDGGRTSRFLSKLVMPQNLLSASVSAGYPAERHAGLALVYAVPMKGDSLEKAAKLVRGELKRLVEDGVEEEELRRVQKGNRAMMMGVAQSPAALASALASYHALTGDWRGMLDEMDEVQALTPDDLLRSARSVFRADNCFTGYIEPLAA